MGGAAMANRTTEQSRFKVPEGMIIERDVDIPMDDGLVLKADVYRPDTRAPVPVILTMGPYGKGVMYQDHDQAMVEWLVGKHPDILGGSTRSFLTWETVDPEIWVPWGYAVVRADSRGAGRSPGYLDIFSPRETRDFYHCIEWPARSPGPTARSASTASRTTPSTSGTSPRCSRRI